MKTLDARLSNLKTALASTDGKRNRYGDPQCKNLYLNIAASGTKSWLFIWQHNGVQSEFGLGSASTMNLEQARAAARRVHAQFDRAKQQGLVFNPIEAKRQAKAKLALVPTTFGDVVTRVIERDRASWKITNGKCGTAEEWTRTRDKYCLSIRDKRIAEITTNDIISVLEPMWHTINDTAHRVQDRMEQVMNYAIARDLYEGKNPARWAGHLEEIMPKVIVEKKHHAMLDYTDMGDFMAMIASRDSMVVKAMLFTMLTAVRTANVIAMVWSEVDFAKKVWTIPACRMKIEARDNVKIAHTVPLSDWALAILESVKGLHPTAVFPGKAKGGFLASGAMNEKLTDTKAKGGFEMAGKATMHGFRASFGTWIETETFFPAEEREFALAHVKKAEIAAYQRGDSVEKRREMMQAWADMLAGKIAVDALRTDRVKSHLRLVEAA